MSEYSAWILVSLEKSFSKGETVLRLVRDELARQGRIFVSIGNRGLIVESEEFRQACKGNNVQQLVGEFLKIVLIRSRDHEAMEVVREMIPMGLLAALHESRASGTQ